MAARTKAQIQATLDNNVKPSRPDNPIVQLRKEMRDRHELAVVERAQQRTHMTRQNGVGAVGEFAYY